jgi:hypothetical protein
VEPQCSKYGLFAVATAVDLKGDMPEVFMAFAPVFHSANLLNKRTEDIVVGLMDAGASTEPIDEIRRFAGRQAANRSLKAFDLRRGRVWPQLPVYMTGRERQA